MAAPADLLQTLIIKRSQDSFHSLPDTSQDASNKRDLSPPPDRQSPSQAPTSKTKQDDTTIAAFQAAGLSVQDVNTYLNDPENATVLASAKRRKGTTVSPNPTTTNGNPNLNPHLIANISKITDTPVLEPVQLGNPQTSYHVAQLNHLCQERGLRPIFEFAEPTAQRFSVVLRFGEVVVTLGGDREGERQGDGNATFGSKRGAKEAVAAKGIEVLKEMPVPGSAPGGPGGAGAGAEENWVGKLAGKEPPPFPLLPRETENNATQRNVNAPSLTPRLPRPPTEFYNPAAQPAPVTAAGPIYTDYALGTNYACECIIPKRPDAAFGARTRPFPNKKAAKANAAREAVLWLVENGDMSRTTEGMYVVAHRQGKKKKGKSGAGVTAIVAAELDGTADAQGGAGDSGKEASFAARVNGLCTILGLSPPEYRLVQSAQAPSMYSGAAHFVHDPLLNDNAPVGEVRLVFGRKNAREACAEKVLGFLRGVLRERGGADL